MILDGLHFTLHALKVSKAMLIILDQQYKFLTSKGHYQVVQRLINSGKVELDIRDDNNWTPLHLAARKGHHKVVEILVNSVDVDAREENGYTALHMAATNGFDKVQGIGNTDNKFMTYFLIQF